MPTRLTDAERTSLGTTLPAWTWALDRDALRREFRFADFSEAWAFMSRVALLADKHDHHPDWSNAWNTVRIELSTHDAGGVTEKDVALARAIDRIVG